MKEKLFLKVGLSLFLLFPGCTHKERNSLPCLDLNKTYPHKEITLQEIAQVKYIPLQTDTNCLLTVRQPRCVTDDYVIFVNNDMGSVFLFDHTGKIAHIIHREGMGPEEYMGIGPVAFDERTQELFCYLFFDNQINVYRLDGTFVRTLPFAGDSEVTAMYNYNDHLLVCWNDSLKGGSKYYFRSKTDAVPFEPILAIPAEQKISRMLWKRGHLSAVCVRAPIASFVYQNNRYLIADPSLDTIYRLTDRQTVEPVFYRTPSVRARQPYIALDYGLESKDYLFITAVELVYDFQTYEGFPQTPYLVDKKTGEIYHARVYNQDYADTPEYYITSYQLVSGRLVHYFSTEELLDALEKNQLSGELKEMASRLSEDDNGVLMMIDFIQ